MIDVRDSAARLVAGLALVLLSVGGAAASSERVTLCHRPPGSPANAQVLTVGAAAVAAHLKHGDTLGPCGAVCRENGVACASDGDCCSDICRAGTCTPPCTADGGRCGNSAECCGGLCSDQGFCSSQCTAGGPELDQPACTFAAPCCPGYGNCIGGFCWGPDEAQCSLLGDACDDLAGIVCCFDYLCAAAACVAP